MDIDSKSETHFPRLPNRRLLQSVKVSQLSDDTIVEDAFWQHPMLANQHAVDVKWINSIIDHADATASKIKRLSLRCVGLEYLLAANADWSEALLDDVEFRDCKLTGLKLNEAKFATVRLVNCKADFAQFQGVKTKHVIFDHCDLSNAYFNTADLKGAVFDHCDLSHAEFSQAKLFGADFRGSVIEGIKIDPTKLTKAKVDLAQAIYFIQLLGLEIE